MARKYLTIEGRGNFPFEMLTEFEAFPATSKDADLIRYACPTQAPTIRITLATDKKSVDYARWRESGWVLVQYNSN